VPNVYIRVSRLQRQTVFLLSPVCMCVIAQMT